MDGGSNTSDAKAYVTLQIIWLALVISVFIYVITAYFLINSAELNVPQVPVKALFFVFAAVSLCLLFPQILLRSYLSDNRLFPKILEKVRAGYSDTSHDADPAQTILLQNHSIINIVIWALGEAPAIFGLSLTLLSGDLRYIAGFALYSIMNMIFFRPSRPVFDSQLGRLRRHLVTRGYQDFPVPG